MHRRAISVSCNLCAVCVFAVAARIDARPWIDMGPKDDIAFDQPAATFELFQQLPGGGKGASLGPSNGGLFFTTNSFFLDTGAGSIIAINDAESELQDNGYVTDNTVLEQGVAGYSLLDVSADYYVEISDSVGTTVALPHTRIMSGQFEDLFGVNGIAGMPAMVGRVVTLDTSVWTNIEDIFDLVPMEVRFGGSLPASSGHRYSTPIQAKFFGVDGDDPLPNVSPIPMLNMSVGYGSANASGSFVLDTGAAISFISTEMGTAIGLDSNHDGVLDTSDEQSDGTLPIGGIGGTVEAPIFYIDRFTVPTDQGVDLVWNLEGSLAVAIIDIDPNVDGILGSDLLTSGWFTFDFGGDGSIESEPGPLQQTHFDFRQFFADGDPGEIYFDLTPSFDVVQPALLAGDYNDDGTVNAADYTVWRDSFGAMGNNLPADGNGDGSIDEGDYAIWKSNFGQSAAAGGGTGSSAVPEPSGTLLALLAALFGAGARSRRPLAGSLVAV